MEKHQKDSGAITSISPHSLKKPNDFSRSTIFYRALKAAESTESRIGEKDKKERRKKKQQNFAKGAEEHICARSILNEAADRFKGKQ